MSNMMHEGSINRNLMPSQEKELMEYLEGVKSKKAPYNPLIKNFSYFGKEVYIQVNSKFVNLKAEKYKRKMKVEGITLP